eukprot:9174657-Pyramimonas_sp.AAC.1
MAVASCHLATCARRVWHCLLCTVLCLSGGADSGGQHRDCDCDCDCDCGLMQAGSTVVATRANPHHFERLYNAVQDAQPDVGVVLLSVQVCEPHSHRHRHSHSHSRAPLRAVV